jgi:hypothetical protein
MQLCTTEPRVNLDRPCLENRPSRDASFLAAVVFAAKLAANRSLRPVPTCCACAPPRRLGAAGGRCLAKKPHQYSSKRSHYNCTGSQILRTARALYVRQYQGTKYGCIE